MIDIQDLQQMKAEIITIKKSQIEASYRNNQMIIQFGWQIRQQYNKDHILDAIYIDSEELQNSPQWLLKSQQQIRQVFGKHIILHKNGNIKRQKILVYNRHVKQMSILPACRLAILLLHLNIAQFVDVMLGGYQQYLSSHSQSINIIRVFRQSQKQPQKNEYKLIISYQQLQLYKDSQLVDTRTKQQNEGLNSGYNYWQLKGKIPNSIFHGGMISKNSCQVKQYSPKGQFLKMWSQNKIDINRHIILYCGTGWRASQIIVYAILNGVSNISLYSNGWIQWSMRNYKDSKPIIVQSTQSKCIRNMNINQIKEMEEKDKNEPPICSSRPLNAQLQQ